MTLSAKPNLLQAEENAAQAISHAPQPSQRAGYSVEEFCFSVGIGRTSFYALGGDLAPRRIRIRKRTIVTESPAEWVARIEKSQKVAA